MKDAARQLELPVRNWGGRRAGAGRKRTPPRPSVPHRSRDPHDRRCPADVTMRATCDLPSLRRGPAFIAARQALAASTTARFRLLSYSVQADHLHLVVEADGSAAFTRGVRGLAVRIAKAVNRALGRRGRVWAERYHSRLLRTPKEVRNAFVYVLNNVRKHLRGVRGLDPCSSARWFTGWRNVAGDADERSPVAAARTWLASVGWRRHGLIDVDEAPRPMRSG